MKNFIMLITFCISAQAALADSVSDHRVYAASFDGNSCKAVVSGFHWALPQEEMLKNAFIAHGKNEVCNELKTRMAHFNAMATSESGLQYVKNNKVFGPILGIAIEEVAGFKVMTRVTQESGLE
ncbi:MAG: hypothetical protein A2381_00070 [Bdellovibrionales bacterium RIFOXYB1_FULL_37_110]|nr:MAG: hypothetical protein A2181_06080 [Bdellovibrionales bacterium RIFOXYA1_FULL_38_20]OFZ49281.1 MAG: hypothetical protein A2417_17255 [Bdellovibrionales bacterium RIFOXYC1_FULL_37_79]OFZ57742.1 MAG: hypothetical protein A2381_00070 [Bdellovibrionales bacterium RIFOXYB1_FULL_37_110]OFZ61542.1 MAG: hypothetical protein A2577_00535 [Bdellovibrionales bacterium RIFOXYD1_FULL_36_51]